jgi:hypothetical protein
MVGAVGYNSDVGLSVGCLGVVCNGLSVEVLGVWSCGSGGGRDTEAAVEGETVGGLGGHVGDAGEELLVGEVEHGEDLFGVDVGCIVSVLCLIPSISGWRTQVLGGAGDLAEQLDKVRQVIAEELGLEHQVLAGVVGVEFGAQELGFADNAQRRPSLGALYAN